MQQKLSKSWLCLCESALTAINASAMMQLPIALSKFEVIEKQLISLQYQAT
jgi:hypothetical protein